MKIINRDELLNNKSFYIKEILIGKIFIYPTDTIYGIGCINSNLDSILKLNKIKKRESKPFSIIVPSKEWIYENCIIYQNHINWINKLPGPYTFILKLKNNNQTIGVRIFDNFFSKFISEIGICFVTTSVNITKENPIIKLEELKDEIKIYVDYFIDDGELNAKPSKILDLTLKVEKIIRE